MKEISCSTCEYFQEYPFEDEIDMGKRAWNSGFMSGIGKRAWTNLNFLGFTFATYMQECTHHIIIIQGTLGKLIMMLWIMMTLMQLKLPLSCSNENRNRRLLIHEYLCLPPIICFLSSIKELGVCGGKEMCPFKLQPCQRRRQRWRKFEDGEREV